MAKTKAVEIDEMITARCREQAEIYGIMFNKLHDEALRELQSLVAKKIAEEAFREGLPPVESRRGR